jgi:hypothetical protein
MKTSETYVYVVDTTRGDRVWVRESYVTLYPHLYKPVQFKGLTLKSDCPNLNPCVVRT